METVRLIRSTLVRVPVSACWAIVAELMMVRAAAPARMIFAIFIAVSRFSICAISCDGRIGSFGGTHEGMQKAEAKRGVGADLRHPPRDFHRIFVAAFFFPPLPSASSAS